MFPFVAGENVCIWTASPSDLRKVVEIVVEKEGIERVGLDSKMLDQAFQSH